MKAQSFIRNLIFFFSLKTLPIQQILGKRCKWRGLKLDLCSVGLGLWPVFARFGWIRMSESTPEARGATLTHLPAAWGMCLSEWMTTHRAGLLPLSDLSVTFYSDVRLRRWLRSFIMGHLSVAQDCFPRSRFVWLWQNISLLGRNTSFQHSAAPRVCPENRRAASAVGDHG